VILFTYQDDVSNVLIIGGGVRVPKVQQVLKNLIGRELGQSLNGDESFVLGAVFKGAELSGQFRVKDIQLVDLNLHNVTVKYYETPESTKQVEKLLFRGYNSTLGKKERLTFTNTAPFSIEIYQQTVPTNPDGTVQLYSSRLVQTVTVTGFETEAVKKLLAANKWAEPKINVTIEIDDSGLVVVSKAIAEVEVEEPKTTKSTTASAKKAKDSKKKKTYLGKYAQI